MRSRCGRISQGELRRSNLVEVFNTVDEEEDINKVRRDGCFVAFPHISSIAMGVKHRLMITQQTRERRPHAIPANNRKLMWTFSNIWYEIPCPR